MAVPKKMEVLGAAGLHTIAHYVQVQRESILQWVVDRPIFKMYREEERRLGITLHTF